MARSQPTPFPATSLSTPRIVTNPWVMLVVLTLGFFMILLDTTIVNVAIPSIITSLNASIDQVLWVVNAYVLVYAVLLITAGRMGDMFGPKLLFMMGLVLFTISSIACGFAQSPGQLIAFRVIQAVGGAMLTPQSLSLITSIFPPEKRGAAFGVWGAMAGLAAVAGPTLGGFLTTSYSWRAIFYVNVPIGIVALALAYFLLPEKTVHQSHRLDIIGVLLASLGLFAGIFGLIEGQRFDWGRINDTGAISLGAVHASLISIPTLLLLSVILLVCFVWWESRQDEPLLPLSLFHDRNFSVANLVSMIVTFGMFSLFFPLTLFLQSVQGLSAEDAGVALAPMALVSIFFSPIAGRLSDRLNGKYLLAGGLITFGIGMFIVLKLASLDSTGATFTPALIVSGVGMGFMFAPMVTLAMRNIDPGQAGAASGFLNTVRQVGAAVGSAVMGAVLQNQLAIQMKNEAVSYSSQVPLKFRADFLNGFSHAASGGLQLRKAPAILSHNVPVAVVQHIDILGQAVFRHAFLLAFRPSIAISISVLMCGSLVALTMRSGKTGAQQVQVESHSRLAVAGE